MNRRFSALLAAMLFPMVAAAAEPHDPPATAELSPATRALIIAEMQAMAQAMGRIHTAVVSGDHATVSDEARKIHDSFVLKQELSAAQREELGAKLPAGFIAADRAFHVLARNLAQAGEHHDATLQRLWFQEMTRACQSCHIDHAGTRFPGLTPHAAQANDGHGDGTDHATE